MAPDSIGGAGAGVAAPAPASVVSELCADGRVLRDEGRYTEAETVIVRALALAECCDPLDDLLVVEAANELGVLYKHTARFDEAEALYRRALRIVETIDGAVLAEATLWHNLGGLEHSRRRFALAEPAARRAIELRIGALGPHHVAVLLDEAALAPILDALGQFDEAEALLRHVLGAFTELHGPTHYEVAVAASNLAALRYRRGDHEQARELWERAFRIKRDVLGSAHPELAPTLVNLGVLRARSGDVGRARTLFEGALRVLGDNVGREHPTLRAATVSLEHLDRAKRVQVSGISRRHAPPYRRAHR